MQVHEAAEALRARIEEVTRQIGLPARAEVRGDLVLLTDTRLGLNLDGRVFFLQGPDDSVRYLDEFPAGPRVGMWALVGRYLDFAWPRDRRDENTLSDWWFERAIDKDRR
jgi:hypothetical protein